MTSSPFTEDVLEFDEETVADSGFPEIGCRSELCYRSRVCLCSTYRVDDFFFRDDSVLQTEVSANGKRLVIGPRALARWANSWQTLFDLENVRRAAHLSDRTRQRSLYRPRRTSTDHRGL
jgi:hypothetical protein